MVTYEFSEAVKDKNMLRIRIMLKNSLLLDKSFKQFYEMKRYAEERHVNFWMEETEKLQIAEKPWTIELMNMELAALVSDFTKMHLRYVMKIIENVYGSKREVKS